MGLAQIRKGSQSPRLESESLGEKPLRTPEVYGLVFEPLYALGLEVAA